MERAPGYRTRQREAILACLMSARGAHLTAGQIRWRLLQQGEAVGLTTVYRQLEWLAAAGSVRKCLVDGSAAACYQYIGHPVGCREHFHLRCEGCGEVLHLGQDLLGELREKIGAQQGFDVDLGRTVLHGRCLACRKRDKGTPPDKRRGAKTEE